MTRMLSRISTLVEKRFRASPGSPEGLPYALSKCHSTRMLSRISALVLFVFGCPVPSASAKVELAGLFVDHMVVQRDLPIPVWGWAAPGESVTARLAGQQKVATADEKGRWRVEFAALPAGGPHTLEVEAGVKVTVNDVLVGEVWG